MNILASIVIQDADSSENWVRIQFTIGTFWKWNVKRGSKLVTAEAFSIFQFRHENVARGQSRHCGGKE
jgi:hypothetical protein